MRTIHVKWGPGYIIRDVVSQCLVRQTYRRTVDIVGDVGLHALYERNSLQSGRCIGRCVRLTIITAVVKSSSDLTRYNLYTYQKTRAFCHFWRRYNLARLHCEQEQVYRPMAPDDKIPQAHHQYRSLLRDGTFTRSLQRVYPRQWRCAALGATPPTIPHNIYHPGAKRQNT